MPLTTNRSDQHVSPHGRLHDSGRYQDWDYKGRQSEPRAREVILCGIIVTLPGDAVESAQPTPG